MSAKKEKIKVIREFKGEKPVEEIIKEYLRHLLNRRN
jgi:hypothetical protein